MKKIYLLFSTSLFCIILFAQVPVPMSSQSGLSYTENFADIANWTTNFASGVGANRFASVATNATGTIPDGVKVTTATNTFTTGSSGGVQKGTGTIVLLSTGSTDNSSSAAIDFFMDFTGVNAGTLSFAWASLNNSTGDRKGSLRVYYSTNGTTFTELIAAQVLNFTNNSPTSGNVTTVQLPAAFNNSPTARLRFYYYNGTGGTTGSRPKISIDDLTVTATSLSGGDITPPSVVSTAPADNASDIAPSVTAAVTFSEDVQKVVGTTGNIYLKRGSDNSIVQTIPVSSTGVTINSGVVSFNVTGLNYLTAYYIIIDANSFTDLSNNNFSGITDPTAWNFTTGFDPAHGSINSTYSFNTCASTPTDGFTQYSITGAITWACTTFGHDPVGSATASLAYGVQINGFANNTNVPNIDWFISPSFDLTATTFPLLSFWSRTAFNGSQLELKVSTDYSGSGNPNTATWTTLNGKFPGLASDVWTQSANINLSAYKGAHVYVAFVYTSTDEEGARWTMDDIRIDNSPTPPPPSLTVSTNDIQYTFVASGSTSNKTFAFTANDITGNVTVASSSPNFLISKDGTAFSNSVTYTVAEANNTTKTIYVQFAPDQVSKTFSGSVTITTSSLIGTVNVKGTSIDPAVTLEVVNWNMEWFGSTDPSLGPTNDALQQSNAQTILQNIGADVYGLVEVVDEARLAAIVSSMPGYSYVICNYGSHVNPPDPSGGPLSGAQKEAFVYKTSVFSNISTRPLINNQDISSTSYNSWSSGRYPFLMKADVTLNGQTKTINFVLIHAKANTSPTTTSYARRQAAATELHDTLNTYFPNDNIIVLGDFNDDLDQSITSGFTTTSYSAFTNDNANFFSPTLALSLAGKKSTVSFNDVIDHVMLSNEMKAYYMGATASVLTDVSTLVSNYGTTTTDHYPVFTRYAFDPTILPVKLVSFAAVKEASSVKLNWQTSQELNTKEFSVEHSTDGINFTSTASVSATGTASSGASYQVIDAHPNSGINYYRLKTIDFDGKYEYSKIVKLSFNKAFTVGLSPNPASDKITITLANSREPLSMQLVDMNGKVVKRAILTNSTTSFSTAGLSKGLYLVKVQSSNDTYTEKLIIE